MLPRSQCHRTCTLSATTWTVWSPPTPRSTAAPYKACCHTTETGGLSGPPVLEHSNQVIRQLRQTLGKGFPIIGVGGILSAADAVGKIEAGADVVQIYTGLIYKARP
jgi:dihydroorotate dehydrogenase